jgi:hypothetical protein
MANDKVYIIGHNRANYMHHMTANWSPIGQEERNQLCYGVWGTVGSTGSWPEVVNLWEEDGFEGLAASFRHEFSHPSLQDPALADWWARAASFRRGGVDRVLVPAPWTDTIEELCAKGVRGEVYAHEVVKVPQGTAWELLERVHQDAVAVHLPFGWQLVGAWATAMCNDAEVILLWALGSWEAWAEYENAQRTDPALAGWRATAIECSEAWHRTLVVDAPLSPLRTGRQPRVSDRDSYRLPD